MRTWELKREGKGRDGGEEKGRRFVNSWTGVGERGKEEGSRTSRTEVTVRSQPDDLGRERGGLHISPE